VSRRHLGRFVGLVSLLSVVGLAHAQDVSPEDQQALEAALPPAPAPPSTAGLVLQSLNPDIAVVLDVAAAWFSADETGQLGGHDPTETGFHLQQLEVSIGKSVDPYFRFDSNLVFTQFGVEIEEAYGTTLALPGRFQIRLGQFLTRFGRINPTHPHAWDFVDQPLAIGRVFGGEGNRGLGVEGSWLAPLPWSVEVFLSVTDAAGEGTARSFYGADDLGIDTPLDLLTVLAVKQFFPLGDDWSLLLGLSFAGGPNATGHDNRTEVYGVDLYLKYRPLGAGSHTEIAFTSEWLWRRRQVPEDVLTDWNGYAQLSWRFAKRWGTAARWELGTATAATDPLDPTWTEARQRASAQLTFWPTEFSRLRVQGSVDAPAWRDDPVVALFLACELVVGAHGAHRF
jgi:hypothetical protein